MPSELYSQANSLARATNLPNEGDRTSVRVPAPPPRPATLLPQQSTPPYTTNTRTEKEADSNASRQAAGRGAFSSTYSSSTILTPQEKNLNPMTKEEKLVIGSTESGGGGELGQTMPPTSARRRENFVGVKGLWGVGGSKKKAKLHQSRVGEAVKEGSNPIQIGNECDDDCDHNDDANTTSSISMSDRSSSLSMSQLISPLEKERLARVKRKYNDEGASTITISKEVKNKSAYSRNNSSGAADIVEVGYVVGEGLLSGPQHFLAPLEGLSPTPRRVMLNAQTRKAIIGGPRVAYANPAYYKHDFLGRGKKPVSDENKRKKEIKNNKKQIRRAEEEEGLNKEKGHLSSGSTSFDHDEGASSSAETSDPSDSSVRTADGQDEEHDDDDDHNRAHEKDQDEISDFVDAVLKRARRRGGATASVEQGYGMGKYISKSPSLSTSSAPEKRRRGQLSPLSLDSQSVSREFFQSVRDFQSARKKAFVRILAEGREASPSSHPVGIVPLSGFVDRYQEYRDAADDYDDHNNEEGEGGNYAVGGATSPPVRGTRKGRRVSFEEKRLFPKVFSSYLHNNNTNTKLDKRGGQADAGTTQKNNNITNTDDAHYTNIGKRADLGFDHLFSHHLHVHEQRDEEDPSGLLEHAFEEAVRRDKALHPHTNSAVEEELGLYERLSDPEAFSEWLQREVGIGSVGNHVNVVGGTEGPRTNGDEGQSGKGSPTHSDPSSAISLTALVARVALLEQETDVASANNTSTFTDPTDDGLILNYSHSLQSNPQLNSKSQGREDDDTSSLAQAAGTSTATGTSKVVPLLDHQTYQQQPHESSPSTCDSFMNTTRSAKIRRIMISAAPYCRSVGEVDRFLHGYFSFSAAPFRREERDKVLSLENIDDPSSEESARDDGGSCGSGDKENEEEVRGGEAEEERPTLGALLKSFRAWRVTINPMRDEEGGVGGATDTVVNLAAHALTTNMKKHRIGRTSKTKWSSGKAEASRNNGDDDELKNNKWTTKIRCTSPASSSSSSHVLLPTTEVHQQSSSYRKLSETSEIAMQLIGNAMGRLNAFSYPLSFDELHMDCANCLEGLQKDRQNLLGGNSTNGNSSAADTAATTKGGTAAGITAEARLINAIFGVEDRTPTNTRSNDVLETHDGDIHHRRMDSTKAAKGGGRGDDSANNSNIEDTNSKHNNNNNNNKSTYNNIANTVAVSAITRETPVAVHVKGPVLMHVPYVDSNKALDKAHDAVIALSIALAQEEEKEEEDQKEKETRRERTKLTDEEEEEAKGSAKSTFVAFAPAPSPPPQPLGFSFPLPLSTCTKKEYDEEAGNAASISSTSAKNILQQTFAVVGKGRKSILTLIPQSQSPTIKNVAHISGGDEGTTAPTLFKTPLQLSDEEEEDESNKKDRNPQATLFLRKLAKRMSISLQGEGSLLGSCSTSMRARKEEDTCTGGGDGLSPRRGEGGENNSTVAFVEAEVETSGVQKIDGPTVATATPTTTTKEGSEPKTKISKELCRKRQSLVSTVVAGVPVHQIRGTFFRALSFLRNPDEDPLFAAQSFLLANNGDINSSSAKEHPLNNYRIKEHTQSTLLSEKNSSSDLLTPSALAYEAYVMQREKETPTYLIRRGSSSSSPQPRAVSGLSKRSLPDGRHNLNKIWPSEDGVSSIVEATAAQRRTNASASHVWRLEETAAAHGVAVESLIATYIRLLVDRDRCGEDRYSSLAGGGDRRAGATPANRNDLGLLLGDDTSSFLLRSYTYLSAVDITEMLGQLQLFSSTLVAPAPPADSESRNRSQHSLDERQNLRRRSTLEFRKDAEDEGKERIVYVHAEMLPNNSPNRCAAANPMSETNKMITCTQPEEVVGVDKEVSTRGFMAGFHESFEAFAGGSADVIRIVPQHASGSVGATGTDCFFPSSSSSFSLSASNALHHPNAPSHRQLSNRKKKSADNDTISSSRADVRKDSTSSLYPSSHGKSIPASSIAWLKQQGSEYFIFPMPSQEGVVAHDRRGEYRRGAGGKRGDDETQGNDGGLNIDDVSHQRLAHRGKNTFPPESELRDGEEEVFSFEGYNKTWRPLVAAAAASVLTPKDIRLAFDLDYEEAVPGGGWLTTLDQLIKHVKHQLLPITHCILEPVSVVGFFLGKLAVFLKCQVAIDEEDAVSRDEVLALINTILSERLSKFSSAALTLEAQITELEKMEQDEVRVRRLMENDLLGPLELIVGQLLRNVPFFHQREALSLASEDIIRRSAAVMDFLHELESTAPSSVGAADQWVRSLIDEGYARLEANVARGWATLSCGFIDPALRKFVIDTDPYAKENRGNEVLAKIVGSEFIVDDDGKARRVGGRGMSRQFGAAAGPSLLLSLAAQQQQHPAGSLVRQYLFDLTEHSVSRLESLMKRKRRGTDHVDTDGDSYDENGHDTTEPEGGERYNTAVNNDDGRGAAHSPARGRGGGGAVASDGDVGVLVGMTGSHRNKTKKRADAAAPTLRERVAALGLRVISVPSLIKRFACEYKLSFSLVALKVKGVASESIGRQLCLSARHFLDEAGAEYDTLWGFCAGLASSEGI